jgi:hypothetical protein
MSADTLFVSPKVMSPGDGQTWESAIPSIADAIAAWKQGDEIWVAKGTYDIASSGIEIPNGLHLYGGFKGTETIREQRDWYRNLTVLNSYKWASIFTLNQCDSITRIDGFVLRGTKTSAMVINGGAPRIFNLRFSDCSSEGNGAAIRMTRGGRIQIEYCVFENCTSEGDGGAVYINSDITSPAWNRQWGPFIGQSFFINCVANRGGGVYISGSPGTSQIVSSVFSGNSAAISGGAIGSDSSDLYVNNVTFYKNYLTAENRLQGKSAALNAGMIQNCLMWNGDEDTTMHVAQLKPDGDTLKLVGRSNVIERDYDYGFWQFQPDFVDTSDLDGPDNIYGTDDDGLNQLPGSIGRDGGYLDAYVNHRQHDVIGNPRLVGRKIDIGAYESQRDGRMGYREVMKEMRKGGLVFMYRHGKTDWDQKDKGPSPECFPGRNLIAEGREQCDEIGKAQRMLGVPQGEAFSSPACRCWETLQIMVGRYEKKDHWAGGGASGQTEQRRLQDLSTPVTSGNRFISTHDAVCQAVYNGYGTGELITTAEYMEGDALIVRPLGGTENEILAHWCSENWTRYHVRFPDEETDVYEDPHRAADVTVAPVPASEIVRIGSSRAGQIRIVNVLGVTIATVDLTSSQLSTVDVSAWPSGRYFVIGATTTVSFAVLH